MVLIGRTDTPTMLLPSAAVCCTFGGCSIIGSVPGYYFGTATNTNPKAIILF